jgi:MFS family permease
MFSTTFTYTVVTVALKTVATDLHSTPNVVAWVVTAPALALSVSLPIFGRLGDAQGHRKVYLVGIVTAILFNVLAAVATSAVWLITARTIAQVAGTATWPASYAMLFRYFPPDQRIRATAWASGTATAASVTGLVIGGPTISAFGWRPLFVAQALLAFLALLAAVVVLRPDQPRTRTPIDLAGAAVLAVSLFCLTLGINRMAADGPSPLPLALLVFFPLALVSLWKIERSRPAPLLPINLITNRQVQCVSGASLLLGFSYTGSFVVTPLLLQSVFGLSVLVTSIITAGRTLSVAGAAPFASRVGVRIGEKRLLMLSSLGVAAGMAALAFGTFIGALGVVVAALILTGFMNGHAQPSTVAMMGNAVDQEHFGLASSLQQMANQIGGVAGIGLFTAIAANSVSAPPFALGFVIAAGLMALIPVFIYPIRRTLASADGTGSMERLLTD